MRQDAASIAITPTVNGDSLKLVGHDDCIELNDSGQSR